MREKIRDVERLRHMLEAYYAYGLREEIDGLLAQK
jgi:hypothetical protein